VNGYLWREYLLLALPLATGGVAAYWPLRGEWGWGPLLLGLILPATLTWYHWGEATVPRQPLGPAQDELGRYVAAMAELGGVRLREVAVVPAEEGQFEPSETLARVGVVVFTSGELERNPLSVLLGVAARQLALAQAPPRYAPWGAVLVGAALGSLLALRDSFPSSGAAALALAGACGVVILAVARNMHRGEVRGQWLQQRARELLGLMRDKHPDAFRDLSIKQGLLKPEE
jgi:hypothetical protein